MSEQSGEQQELVAATVAHIRWGLKKAVDEDDIPEIQEGSIHELARLTCAPGSDIPQIHEERLRRRLMDPEREYSGSYNHRPAGQQRRGPIPMTAWEYLLLCFDLGISTNPYVETDHDRANGVMTPKAGRAADAG